MKKRDLRVFAVIMTMAGFIASCNTSESELGADLLPSDDDVSLLYDTIFEITAYPVTGKPLITSENIYQANAGRLMLMGNIADTIVGTSEASLITQFNTTSSFVNGPNMEIDTLMLSLYIQDYIGDTGQEITIAVHEFTERIYMDSVYTSDFSAEGKFDQVPLVEKSIVPVGETTFTFLIEDQAFIDKFLAIETDTSYFRNDSVFKDYFKGFYLTAQSSSLEGLMARVQLSSALSRISLKYANDSTEVDSTAGKDFIWTHFTINEYYSQKINIFRHDYSGTYLSSIIDDPSANSPYTYVQGIAGVNTRFSFDNLDEWLEKNPLAINLAHLIFDVVPEEQSGIPYDDLPDRLMAWTILEDNSYEIMYDFLVLENSNQGTQFGGVKKANAKGMFGDTTYIYRFNMPLHFQSMVDGVKPDNNFILKLADEKSNPRISKFWSNLPADKKRIRLEIVYLKL